MAKGYKKQQGLPDLPAQAVADRDIFTPSSGRDIHIRQPDHFFFQQLVASKETFEPPTYSFPAAGGGTIVKAHDEQSIKDPATSEADKAAWAEYKEKSNQAEADFARRVLEFFILDAADLEAPEPEATPDDPWVARCRRFNVPIAKDPDERKLQYVLTWYFRKEEDATDFMAAVIAFISQEDEAAKALKDTFRAAIQEARAGRLAEARKQLVDIGRAARRLP